MNCIYILRIVHCDGSTFITFIIIFMLFNSSIISPTQLGASSSVTGDMSTKMTLSDQQQQSGKYIVLVLRNIFSRSC